MEIPIYFYIDDEGVKHYDYEEIANEFENRLSKITNVRVMCSVVEEV